MNRDEAVVELSGYWVKIVSMIGQGDPAKAEKAYGLFKECLEEYHKIRGDNK